MKEELNQKLIEQEVIIGNFERQLKKSNVILLYVATFALWLVGVLSGLTIAELYGKSIF